jgi:hypothetical protein
MPVISLKYDNGINGGVNVCLVFLLQNGDKTAIVFAQHPDTPKGVSVVNAIETIARQAFRDFPKLHSLNEKDIEIYSTLGFIAPDNRITWLQKVVFTNGVRRKPSFFSREWFSSRRDWAFSGATWEKADPRFTEIFNIAAREAGFEPK